MSDVDTRANTSASPAEDEVSVSGNEENQVDRSNSHLSHAKNDTCKNDHEAKNVHKERLKGKRIPPSDSDSSDSHRRREPRKRMRVYRSPSTDSDSESLSTSPNRKRSHKSSTKTKKHRSHKRSQKPSRHEQSSSDCTSSSPASSSSRSDTTDTDDSYEAYDPNSDEEHQWKMNKKMRDYAKEKFTSYINEKTVKRVVKECPKPKHAFLKAAAIDSDIDEGLETKVGKKATYTKAYDRDLNTIQMKVLRIMGPLGRLWNRLEEVRKKRAPSTADLGTFLKLTEQTLLLVGQTNNALLYQRRVNILSTILKDKQTARRKLKKYHSLLSKGGKLFGPKFQTKLAKNQKTHGLLSIGTNKKPFRKGPPQTSSRGGRPQTSFTQYETTSSQIRGQSGGYS